jgi:iron complex outermembrane receptor protein
VIPASRALAQSADQPPAASGGVTPLPPVDVNGEGGEAPGNSVNGAGLGGRFTGYTVDISTPAVATKSDIPILQTPGSIQVVPREVIDDQQALSVTDALVGNVSSVQPSSDAYYPGFNIRGFDNASIYRNDLLVPNLVFIETANLQSIEVLKGPAAMLFGRLEPGGIVNLVVKRPLETPYYSIQEQAGSWGLTRTTVDASGPLTEDKTWLYRINLDFTHADSFRNFVTTQDGFVAPTITYHPIEQFRLNLDAEYQNRIFVADSDNAIPAIGTRPAPIPISTYLQDPAVTAVNPSRMQRGFIGYDWTFDIAKDWSVTNRFGYYDINYAQRITDYNSVDELTGLITRGDWDVNAHRTYLSSNLDLNGKFETGPLNHDVLIGTDYHTETNHDFGFSGNTPTVGPINMFFPTYSLSGYVKPPNNFFFPFQQSWEGVYGQDMISFADDKLHLLIGGRYDWANYGYGFSPTSFVEANGPFNPVTGNGFQNAFDQAFSPRIGAVVQPAPWLSFYGDYVKSFGATNGLPAPGQPSFPPEMGRQWEGGAKAEFFDKRLTATVAFYDILKTNVVQSIPGTQFSSAIGLVESKGAEFDIAGRIDENWSLIGSYAFDSAHILNGQGYTVTGVQVDESGNRLQNVPYDAASIWVKYDASGDFRGVSAGGGVVYVGERQGDNVNSFQLPAYTVVNTMIMYRLQPAMLPSWLKNATIQLNVKNLLNTTYYTNSYDRFSIYPGAPRTFLASLRAEF